MTIMIDRKDLDRVIEHCRAEHPYEACGILAGTLRGGERVVVRVYPTRNILRSPTRYQIDPEEQIKIFEEIEGQGLNIIGFYHSHPHFPARPSGIDRGMAYYPGHSYLIISLMGGGVEVGSYVWRDGFEEEDVKIVEQPPPQGGGEDSPPRRASQV